MMLRRLLPLLLAIGLVTASLTGVVAQTRMAAAGGFCANGTPEVLLDQMGLPLLDADGNAIAAPDCPACHVASGLMTAPVAGATPPLLLRPAQAPPLPSLPLFAAQTGAQARAPPNAS